jgi:hypothetical protein
MNWQDVFEGAFAVLAILSLGCRFLLNRPSNPVRVVEDTFAASMSTR